MFAIFASRAATAIPQLFGDSFCEFINCDRLGAPVLPFPRACCPGREEIFKLWGNDTGLGFQPLVSCIPLFESHPEVPFWKTYFAEDFNYVLLTE